MQNYYFRVDGGDIYSIATGHITRCLKLADYISLKEKVSPVFIMKDYPEGVALVEKKKYRVNILDKGLNFEEEVSQIKGFITDGGFYICDLRGIDNDYIRKIKGLNVRFVLFDDLGVKGLMPDVLINPTPFCRGQYDIHEYPDMRLLLGEEFFFVNEGLIERSRERDFHKPSYDIMASFGGADPCNITGFFLEKIAPRLSGNTISLVLGPAYKHRDKIMKNHDLPGLKICRDVSLLDDMFLSHDIAFVCGGDTCIESCASGSATFIISSIYYEREIAEKLQEKGAAVFLSDINEINKGDFNYNRLDRLLSDRENLASVSRRGRELIDGKGRERLYNILKDLR